MPRYIDLDWLMAGGAGPANTLYLAAPSAEFERLSPVLGGLLADLKDTIHAWDIAGQRLDKPLLIVIDEAAHLQLGWLPTEVSTIAALGAFFVTCWQNLRQIHHRYGTLADAVLSGHRTKCFFAGVDDPADHSSYLTGCSGTRRSPGRAWSQDVPTMWGNPPTAGAAAVRIIAARGVRARQHDPADVPRRRGTSAWDVAAGPPRQRFDGGPKTTSHDVIPRDEAGRLASVRSSDVPAHTSQGPTEACR